MYLCVFVGQFMVLLLVLDNRTMFVKYWRKRQMDLRSQSTICLFRIISDDSSIPVNLPAELYIQVQCIVLEKLLQNREDSRRFFICCSSFMTSKNSLLENSTEKIVRPSYLLYWHDTHNKHHIKSSTQTDKARHTRHDRVKCRIELCDVWLISIHVWFMITEMSLAVKWPLAQPPHLEIT